MLSQRILISSLLLVLAITSPLAAAPQASPQTQEESFQASARGFGKVTTTLRCVGDKKEATWTRFATEDADHAVVCASKRLADLFGFGDVKLVTDKTLPGTVLELKDAGFWLLGTTGAEFHELYAPTKPALAKAARQINAATWQPVKPKSYPRWLDCFDNAGPGVWVGGGGDEYTLPSDFEWLRERKLTMCTQFPSESSLAGPGIVDTSIFDWHTAMAAQYDIPYRALLFPANYEWLWNREPLPYAIPEAGRTLSCPWLGKQANSSVWTAEPVPAVDPYVADLRRQLAGHLQSDPNYIGMHGCTEIPDAGINNLGAIQQTPGVKELWHHYLKTEAGLDLAAVGKLHKGNATHYPSWDAVEVPHSLDFTGWNPATCLDLRGIWQMHEDLGHNGEALGWFDPAKAPADWVAGDSNDPMILLYKPKKDKKTDKVKQPDFWMRRNVQISADRRDALRYLHIARAVYHNNFTITPDVWINGKKIAPLLDEIQAHSLCFDIGSALKEGDNQFVLNTHGSPIAGYFFLGGTPLRPYPYMTETENRLWFDAVNFDGWLRVAKIENHLKATRAADPNRPLKMMATINLLDLVIPLCERYGAYQHDTGAASGFWCPMTGARLSRTHGLPFSCEQGGPPNTAERMRATITYHLLYGNDASDLVFRVAHYRDVPEVATWFDANLDLVHSIGKLQLPPTPIGVLRSSRATRLGFRDPWNWDIGRGTLQGVGRNFSYLEVPDLSNGTIDQFRVIIDDGTVLLTEAEIQAIKQYVDRGGIFIAQHHTGRHSPGKADTWALAQSWGLNIAPKYITDANYHRWPVGKIRFTAEQDLIPSLRGQEAEGSGVSVDYQGTEFAGAISIQGGGKSVTPVAKWEDGSMAIADIREGKGRFILLGTPFYLRMKDVNGTYFNDTRRQALLDEFLVSLGVPRDSWTGSDEIWAEAWRSKNGLYDLYPVARMSKTGDPVQKATVEIRRDAPATQAVEIGAKGHPAVNVVSKDGKIIFPPAEYGPMQTRLYAIPRADLGRSGIDWFRAQASIWRALDIPEGAAPKIVPVPDDILPLADGWSLKVEGQPDRRVKMGAFGTLNLPDATSAAFEQTITIPKAWAGKRIDLNFAAEDFFWGILPQGRLYVNGKAIPQPIEPTANPGFSIDVTEAAAGGTVTLRLEIDGIGKSMMRKDQKGLSKPHGVTGLFYLQSTPLAIETQPLPGPWSAATAYNRMTPTQPGEKAQYVYLETRFSLPKTWPAQRLFLESPEPLGFLVLNGQVLQCPAWMKRLDISRLARPDAENVLRWIPAARSVATWNKLIKGIVPEMRLSWMPY